MRRRLPFLLPLFASSLFGATHYSLDALITLGLHNSPDINVSMLDYNRSQERITTSRSDYLPRVDAELFGGYIHLNSTAIKNDNSMLQGSITASQLIYDFGKTGGAIEASTYESNASYMQYAQAIADKIFEIKQSYYNFLSAKNLILVYEQNLALTNQQLHRASRFFSAGIKTKIDVYDANVSVIRAQKELHDARYDLRLSNIALMKSLGLQQSLSIEAIQEVEVNQSTLETTLQQPKSTIKKLVDFALTHRADYLSFERGIDVSKVNVRQATSGYYPGIYATGNYSRQKSSDEIEALLPTEQYTIGVNLKWNLFEGFKTDALSQEAKFSLLQSESSRLQAKLALIAQTNDAYISLLRAFDRVNLSNAIVHTAEAKFSQAQKRYENGLSDYIELQEARQGFINAKAELVVDYFNYFISQANLDRAIGR